MSRAVPLNAQRDLDAGDQEQQADRRIGEQVLQRVEPVVTWPIGDRQVARVEDLDEAWRIATRAHVDATCRVHRVDNDHG